MVTRSTLSEVMKGIPWDAGNRVTSADTWAHAGREAGVGAIGRETWTRRGTSWLSKEEKPVRSVIAQACKSVSNDAIWQGMVLGVVTLRLLQRLQT